MLRSIDIERAYAYCKGALTSAQRAGVESRRMEDEEFDSLIVDIQELFKNSDAATVDKVVQGWKYTRTGNTSPSQGEKSRVVFNKKVEAEDDELSRLLIELDKKKRLQKMYIAIAIVLAILILVLLTLKYTS